MEYINYYNSPLGTIVLKSDGKTLTSLSLKKQNQKCSSEANELKVFYETKKWLDVYFSGKEPSFMPEMKLSGTPFQISVYKLLQTIPYGETMTYGEIADIIAKQKGIKKMSAQAIGGAVKKNNIMILIPCHRVIGASRNLVGYSGGGIENKIKLLKLEGINF